MKYNLTMNNSYSVVFRNRAIELRKAGKTYAEIKDLLKRDVPKATMSFWFRSIQLTPQGTKRLERYTKKSLKKAREASGISRKQKLLDRMHQKTLQNEFILKEFDSDAARRIALGILYMAEGKKVVGGSVTFGNSDPAIIQLFLNLFRKTFKLDEAKFRCTLQGRADHDIPKLEEFWSNVTKIPRKQFYTARIDPRSVGKISKKKEYKGVCRIDYISADLLCELMVIGSILTRARSSAG